MKRLRLVAMSSLLTIMLSGVANAELPFDYSGYTYGPNDWRFYYSTEEASFDYKIISKISNKCLEVIDNNYLVSPVHQWDCHDGDNQKFRIYHSEGSSQLSAVRFVPKHTWYDIEFYSLSGWLIDTYPGDMFLTAWNTTYNGMPLFKYDYLSNPVNPLYPSVQEFELLPVAGGPWYRQEYMIRSLINGKCLDVEGWDRSNGATIQLWDCHAGDNQRFYIKSEQTEPESSKPVHVYYD